MINEIRIVVIDDEGRYLPTLVDRWKTIAEFGGMESDITTFTDWSDSKILSSRPHVVVVDNVGLDELGKEVENRGVDFICESKMTHQDTIFILSTSKGFTIDVMGNKFPNPDRIVPKTMISSKPFQEYLGRYLYSNVKRLSFTDLNFDRNEDAILTKDFRGEFRSIIEQCLHPVYGPLSLGKITGVKVYGLSGGYSGSYVFRLELFGDFSKTTSPLVLKVSDSLNSEQEIGRYNAYVRLMMPHDMRVDLLGSGEAGSYSGALYSFAFGDATDIVSMKSKLNIGETVYIKTVVEELFLNKKVHWYELFDRDSTSTLPRTIDEHYNNSLEFSPAKDSDRLDSIRKKLELRVENVRLDSANYDAGTLRLEHIRKLAFKFNAVEVPWCICHGDLNSNNIVIGNNGSSMSLIDFDNSGVDIYYKDFAVLEASCRADIDCYQVETSEDFIRLVQKECEFHACNDENETLNDDFVPQYFSDLKVIRQAAKQALKDQSLEFDSRLYALTLGFSLFKICSLDIWNKSSDDRLLAGYLGALYYLSK